MPVLLTALAPSKLSRKFTRSSWKNLSLVRLAVLYQLAVLLISHVPPLEPDQLSVAALPAVTLSRTELAVCVSVGAAPRPCQLTVQPDTEPASVPVDVMSV